MTPERWQQVERLYHSAQQREPGRRAARQDQFLAVASPNDALARFMGEIELAPLAADTVPLAAALGRVLAQEFRVSPSGYFDDFARRKPELGRQLAQARRLRRQRVLARVDAIAERKPALPDVVIR